MSMHVPIALVVALVSAGETLPAELSFCGYRSSKFLQSSYLEGSAKQAVNRRATGTRSSMVIFAGFDEQNMSIPPWAANIFNSSLPGSFSHFYERMSYGKLRVDGKVASRYYRSHRASSEYLSNDDSEIGEYGNFNLEIIQEADLDIDFSQFDNDGADGISNSGDDDGVVDALFVVLSEIPTNFLIGNAVGMGNLGFSGMYVTNDKASDGGFIQISPVLGTIQRGRTLPDVVGLMSHEYGHTLGLPDLYPKESLRYPYVGLDEMSAGIGSWGLMGFGALGWNGNDGPNRFCAWSLTELGWGDEIALEQNEQEIHIEPVSRTGEVYRIPLAPEEYFLLEFRQRDGSYYDRDIPGEGLLVWHVRHANGHPNFAVDLECADGRWLDAGFPLGTMPDGRNGEDNLDFWAPDRTYNVEHGGNFGDATDPFDGRQFKEFVAESNPSSYGDQGRTSIVVRDIEMQKGEVTAQVAKALPFIDIDTMKLVDESGDAIAVAGEQVELRCDLFNVGGRGATGVTAVLASSSSGIDILRSDLNLGDFEFGPNFPLDRYICGVIRISETISGIRKMELVVEFHSDQGVIGRHPIAVTGVSPKQELQSVTVVDSVGNSDGAVQASEIFGLRFVLDVLDSSLLQGLYFEIRPLTSEVALIGHPSIGFGRNEGSGSQSHRAPEFLVGETAPGTSLRFELTSSTTFSSWKDTIELEVAEGPDETPPRVGVLQTRMQDGDLSIFIEEGQILEGSHIQKVTAVVFDSNGAPLATIRLLPHGTRFAGIWQEASPGTYLIHGVVEDQWGNIGRGSKQVAIVHSRRDEKLTPNIRLGKGRVEDLAYSPNGNLLAVATSVGVRLFDAHTGTDHGVLAINSDDANSIAFNPDGSTLAVGSRNGSVHIVDISTGNYLFSSEDRTGSVSSLAFNHSGGILASAHTFPDEQIVLWDVTRARKILSLDEDVSAINAVKFSHDGTLLAAAGRDQTIRLWQSSGQSAGVWLDIPTRSHRLISRQTDQRLFLADLTIQFECGM